MTIENAWSFSSIFPIISSKGFSVETLTKVRLCHGRPSWIRVSLSWKTEYLDCCIITTWVCCKEDSYHKRQTCRLDAEK